MDDLMKFFKRHENKDGPVGEFIRSCILLAERADFMTRDELKECVQLNYLLDCFSPASNNECEP